MKALISFKISLLFACIVFISSWQKDDPSYVPLITEEEYIKTRTGECDFCYNQFQQTCCCKVTLNQLASIDLTVCGVYNNNNISNCTMDTGDDDCHDVSGNLGVRRTLTAFHPVLYFCIVKDNPFTLYNGNGSGEGHIWVDCNSSGVPPGGQYGINLSYTTGGFSRYVNSDSSCDLEFCDY